MVILIYLFLVISEIEPMFIGFIGFPFANLLVPAHVLCPVLNWVIFLLGKRSPLAVKNIHLLSVTVVANIQFVSNIAF